MVRKILSFSITFVVLMSVSAQLVMANDGLDATTTDVEATAVEGTDAVTDAVAVEADASLTALSVSGTDIEIDYEVIEPTVEIVDAEIDEDYIDIPKAFLLEVIWGDIDNSVEQSVDTTDWSGQIVASDASVSLVYPIKFEGHDESPEEIDDGVSWGSTIYSHYDGVLLKVRPESDDMKVSIESDFFGTITLDFDDLRAGHVVEFDEGYKIAFKVHHPLEYWKKFRENPFLLLVRWGNLEGGFDPDAEQIDYTGSATADGVHLKLLTTLLFENGQDSIISRSGESVEFESTIAGHWDGMLLNVRPVYESTGDFDVTADSSVVVEALGEDEDSDSIEDQGDYELDDALAERSLTVTVGDFSKTFYSADDLGVYDMGDGYQLEVVNVFDYIDGLSDARYLEILIGKIGLYNKCERVYNFVKEREEANPDDDLGDLVSICDELGRYNFDKGTVVLVLLRLEAFVRELEADGITSDKVYDIIDKMKELWEEFKEKSKLAKYEAGIIPFKDVDDDADVWYKHFVAKMYDAGIVSGYKDSAGVSLGLYKPGNNVTVAEILKISLLTAGYEISDDGTELPDSINGHWAREFFMVADELGLTIVSDLNSLDPNSSATRSEVVRLVLEAFGVEVPEADTSPYSDVSTDHADFDYIVYATDLGIVAGDSTGNTFRPDETVNRAEVAKIIENAIELLGE